MHLSSSKNKNICVANSGELFYTETKLRSKVATSKTASITKFF